MSDPVKVFGNAAKFDLAAVLADFSNGLKYRSLWMAFAANEIQARYRRSMLGIAWIVISYLMLVGAIALFFGSFSQMSQVDFVLYVALGYAGFQYIVGNISDGCEVFRASEAWIKSTPLPYSVYVYIRIVRSVFPFVLHMVTALLVMAFMGWRPDWGAIYVLPALAVYLFVSPPIQLIFGLIATRWEDVLHLVSAATRLLFFLTPVMWVYDEQAGLRYVVATVNPITHFLEIFRAPLLGQPVPMDSWGIVLALVVAIWAIALILGAFMRRRLPFWL